MDNKIKIIISIIMVVIVVSILFIIGHNKKTKVNSNNGNEQTTASKSQTRVEVDKDTGEYVVYNSDGEEITRVMDKAAVQIYIDNPDYNPKFPMVEDSDIPNEYVVVDE